MKKTDAAVRMLLENIADLREALEQDVEYGNISKEELKKLLEECKEYFDE